MTPTRASLSHYVTLSRLDSDEHFSPFHASAVGWNTTPGGWFRIWLGEGELGIVGSREETDDLLWSESETGYVRRGGTLTAVVDYLYDRQLHARICSRQDLCDDCYNDYEALYGPES